MRYALRQSRLAPAPFAATGGVLGWPTMPMLVQAARPFQFPTLVSLDEGVREALQRMRQVEGLQESTIAWTRAAYRSLRAFLASGGRERAFLSGDLQEQGRVLDGWVAEGRGRGLSRVSLNNTWRATRLVLGRVAAAGGMLNPLSFFNAPRFTRPLPRVLSRPAAERVLAVVRSFPWRGAFEQRRQLVTIGLMLLAGLRRGEVLKLQYGDLDPETRTIRITRGKGRHGGRDRTAYMTPQLAEMVRAYNEERMRKRYVHPSYLLATDGDHPIGGGVLRRLFAIVSRGLGSPVNPHSLRHTYATLLRQEGIPDRVAMELLGHRSLQMLQRYSHVFDGEEKDAAARLSLDIHP